MNDAVKEAGYSRSYQVIHLEHAKTLLYAESLFPQETPIVYDAVDCLTLLLERRYASSKPGLNRLLTMVDLLKMRRYEARTLHRFSHVVVSSPIDSQRLGALSSNSVRPTVIPNGVDLQYFSFNPAPRSGSSVVFCGKLDYFPNSQAVEYFIREILPLILRQSPKVRVSVVGFNPPPAIRRLAIPGRIDVTGFVQDIRPFLYGGVVGIAPILTKAGTQFKILEALAVGMPMVTTSLACQGLDIVPGYHVLTGDTVGDFAASVVSVLNKAELAESLSCRGRRYVEENHDWGAICDRLDKIYRSLT